MFFLSVVLRLKKSGQFHAESHKHNHKKFLFVCSFMQFLSATFVKTKWRYSNCKRLFLTNAHIKLIWRSSLAVSAAATHNFFFLHCVPLLFGRRRNHRRRRGKRTSLAPNERFLFFARFSSLSFLRLNRAPFHFILSIAASFRRSFWGFAR